MEQNEIRRKDLVENVFVKLVIERTSKAWVRHVLKCKMWKESNLAGENQDSIWRLVGLWVLPEEEKGHGVTSDFSLQNMQDLKI